MIHVRLLSFDYRAPRVGLGGIHGNSGVLTMQSGSADYNPPDPDSSPGPPSAQKGDLNSLLKITGKCSTSVVNLVW